MIRALSLSSFSFGRLLAAGLAAHGLTVDRVSHQMAPNPHNSKYLGTKRDRQGHIL